MRARHLLPIALVLTVLVVLSGCANGGGLRVEGADAPAATSTPVPSINRGFAPTETATPEVTPAAMTLPEVRDSLLAEKRLDPYFRAVLDGCTQTQRCLTRGASVDVMKSGRSQLVVLIHTVDKFVIGAVLMAATPSGPRQVWSLKAEQLKIIPSRHSDLVVESQIFTVDDAPCCPSGRQVEVYRWVGGQMTKVSSKDQEGD